MNTQQAIQLLRSDIKLFYKQFEGVIFKVVDKFCQRPLARSLQQVEVFRQVKRRLPSRLQKVLKKEKERVYFLTILAKSIQVICEDVLDIVLAEQKSPQLLIRYQPFIKMRVISLVNTQYFKAEDEEDVQQIALQKMLEKIQGGKLQGYDAKEDALFSTYFKKIINNQLIDIHRSLYQSQKRQEINELKPELVESQTGMSYHLFDDIAGAFDRAEQVKQLAVLLKMLPEKGLIKFETCLKTSYYFILVKADGQRLRLSARQIKAFLQFFGYPYQNINSNQVWEELAPYLSVFEGKKTSGVNIRKWFTRYRNKILARIMSESLSDYNETTSNQDFLEMLFEKINSDRMVGKAAAQWFRDIVVAYYE